MLPETVANKRKRAREQLPSGQMSAEIFFTAFLFACRQFARPRNPKEQPSSVPTFWPRIHLDAPLEKSRIKQHTIVQMALVCLVCSFGLFVRPQRLARRRLARLSDSPKQTERGPV